jgi:polygalacturonase
MAAGALPAGVVATTFSTEKRNLKERLEQIMNNNKSGARVFAAVLTLALLLGFCAAAGPARAESASGSVETVSSVDGFLAAIGSDRVIELAPGAYDLSAASDYGGESANSCYVWNKSYDGYELEIRGVQNLTIRGAGKGSSSIAAMPRYANVLRFSGCENVSVEALTAGHTTEPGFCTGGVLEFENCERTSVSACGLYGCGILGVRAMNCNDLTVSDSEIYECSYGAVSLDHCRNVRVENFETLDQKFVHTDHNPVMLKCILE